MDERKNSNRKKAIERLLKNEESIIKNPSGKKIPVDDRFMALKLTAKKDTVKEQRKPKRPTAREMLAMRPDEPEEVKEIIPESPKKNNKPVVFIIAFFVFIVAGGITALALFSDGFLDFFEGLANDEILHVYDSMYAIEEESNYYSYNEYISTVHGEETPVDAREFLLSLEINPDIYALDEFFATVGNNVAVFYKNLDTGFVYTHNEERIFFAASLSKSNHALYVYNLAERGYIDLQEAHIFTQHDFWGGTGTMRFMDFETEFTTRELLGLSIRESDNIAYRMLIRMTERKPITYRDFVSEIGANSRMVQNIISQNTTALDAGLWMVEIFNYIEAENQFGHYFKYDLLNTAETSHHYFDRGPNTHGRGGEIDVTMIRSDFPLARKYGWASSAFHDAAIVYAASPYILIILSNQQAGAFELFEEISWLMQDFNYEWFASHLYNHR